MSIGLLIGRLVFGFAFAAHGSQKLFGWFGGHGLKGTGGFFQSMGFRPGRVFALATGLGELGGGMLTALGLGGPLGPALMIVVMIVAMVSVHLPHGFFASDNGVEVPLLYCAAAVVFAFTGPGAYSLDAHLHLRALWAPTIALIAVAAAVVVALLSLVLRRR
ncbi:MAG: DoxX family protein [Thermoanaerobaculales bacterium]